MRAVFRAVVAAVVVTSSLAIGTAVVGAAMADTAGRLTAQGGAEDEAFGSAVALDGDTLVIGSLLRDTNKADVGSVSVYQRADGHWTQETTLVPEVARDEEEFGHAVDLDGDTLVVGVPRADSPYNGGAVHVYRRGSDGWEVSQVLRAAEPRQGDVFGYSVALAGDTLVVGARLDDERGDMAGAAYVFSRAADGFVQSAKLLASDGLPDDRFGDAVATDGHRIVIGARGDDNPTGDDGSVYVFTRDAAGVWTQRVKLAPSDQHGGDRFGRSVATADGVVVVGADGDDSDDWTKPDIGSVYVFRRTGPGQWTEEERLHVPDLAADSRFGGSLAFDGNTIVTGTRARFLTDTPARPGEVFVFERLDGSWVMQDRLAPSQTSNDHFGYAVDLAGDLVAVGAPADQGYTGAAYVFGAVAPTLDVVADVRPRTVRNNVVLGGNQVPVAVMGGPALDAATIDPVTMRFGPAHAEPLSAPILTDVDGDGDLDLIASFDPSATGLDPAYLEACVTGATRTATPILGCDFVNVRDE